MARTRSRLICKSCPTPCSTENVWVVSPIHHLFNSLNVSSTLAKISTIVHTPPLCVCCVYDAFVLGNASNALTTLEAFSVSGPKFSSSLCSA